MSNTIAPPPVIDQFESAKQTESESMKWSMILPVLLIAGLGFFIDVYDIVLFAVVRIASLQSIGVPQAQQLSTGVMLLNLQMSGMIVGAIIWGILGDKKGRKSALFGSIILYSLANLLNGFVNDVAVYGFFRFIAGVGLAGEVGAAMTIAAEVTPKKYRTLGTAMVSGLGILGALFASLIGGVLPWRMGFITAGLAGLLFLFVRMSMKETELFARVKSNANVTRGSLVLLLKTPARVFRVLRCVFSAIPLFFVFGILIAFSPELSRGEQNALGLSVATIALCYSIGETVGEVAAGVCSHFMSSRKKAMLLFLVGAAASAYGVLLLPKSLYSIMCIPVGFFVGYWSVAITSTAEQFGTNLRATATTLVPNLMRASVIPINLSFGMLSAKFGANPAALIVGTTCFALALIAILSMDETFGREMDFVES